MKRYLIILITVVVLLGLAFGAYKWFSAQAGNVTLQFSNIPENTSITFDGSKLEPQSKTQTALTYRLHKGNHRVQAATPGYKLFATNLQVDTGGEYQISVDLQFAHDPTITSSSQVKGLGSGAPITNVTYLYGQTWAVLTLQATGTDPALAAAQYDPVANTWQLEAGPGTYFSDWSLSELPDQVAAQLNGTGD